MYFIKRNKIHLLFFVLFLGVACAEREPFTMEDYAKFMLYKLNFYEFEKVDKKCKKSFGISQGLGKGIDTVTYDNILILNLDKYEMISTDADQTLFFSLRDENSEILLPLCIVLADGVELSMGGADVNYFRYSNYRMDRKSEVGRNGFITHEEFITIVENNEDVNKWLKEFVKRNKEKLLLMPE